MMTDPTQQDREEAVRVFEGTSRLFRFDKDGNLCMPDESRPPSLPRRLLSVFTEAVAPYNTKAPTPAHSAAHRGVETAVLDLLLAANQSTMRLCVTIRNGETMIKATPSLIAEVRAGLPRPFRPWWPTRPPC